MSWLIKYWRYPLVFILLVFCWYCIRNTGYEAAENKWRVRWSERDAAEERAAAERVARNRETEERWQKRIDEVAGRAEKKLQDQLNDAAIVRANADRLRKQIELYKRASMGNASGNSGAASTGAPGRTDCGVLADVLAESVERNQQLAAEADRRRIAGLACEKAYGSMLNQ